MNVRQLCNVAYATLVEWKDADEREQFDRELNADPRQGPVSRGTAALAGLMGGLGRPRPPVEEAGV